MIKEPGSRLLTQVSPRSGLAEGYRMIRSAVSFSALDEAIETIMVTSAGPGEGKSLMAANLAIVHAQKGLRVLLVDCDLRRPSQQKLFDLAGTVGFTNLVVGTATVEEAAQHVGIDNLQVISSGPLPPNPAEMLESARARQVVEELRRHADLVVFDTPPCAALSDPVVLSTLVDGVIVVIESGETDRPAAVRAVHHLAAAKARILGTILNKVNLHRDGYYSYYYYQYYYNSYYSDELSGGRRSVRKMLTASGRKRDEEI
jgi:capsular exopolysaccharide synthesis family protein